MMTTQIEDPRQTEQTLIRRVEPHEYLALAISHRRLTRCDDLHAGVRGFVDLDTGERFVTDAAQLERYQLVGRPK